MQSYYHKGNKHGHIKHPPTSGSHSTEKEPKFCNLFENLGSVQKTSSDLNFRLF